ncbi:LysM peptidoglycan-binding domain-containing protein [Candidatus Dojkabacteria bacterium]|uniref:LysM peptidoglycan-binding domain-containing protein n=1 Tax=Candidatus Dojkabacteria bacterium TaxID=2099670 RepID=A0A3M0YX15_9BACT|nr:MAG: LysM peptidoglycan-binding domain-containing protein [Candidatus Dojkabacteria bacterium]
MGKDIGRVVKVSTQKKELKISLFTPIDLLVDFVFLLVVGLCKLLAKILYSFKIKLYANRSLFYKRFTHTLLIVLTIIAGTGGILRRFAAERSISSELDGGITVGFNDYIFQGSTKNPSRMRSLSTLTGVKIQKYVVKPGETLKQIADRFQVTIDTIRWASLDSGLSPFSNEIKEGIVLTIPEINGVLKKVNPGDTIESILAQVNLPVDEANFANVVELNGIEPPYNLNGRSAIFIPNGNIKVNIVGPLVDIPRGVFTNPLAHNSCKGYAVSRGMTPYHNGVDLAKWDGCVISSVANGVVKYAGWSNYGEGYNVRIDHGGGIVTHYYHGNGEFYVKQGDRVQQGQPIMYMGTSGNSTGVHLHFSLFKDGVAVNPYGYVPF